MKRVVLLAVVSLLSVALAGCMGESGFSFQIDPERIRCTDTSAVDNQPGSFQYGGAASCKTKQETYQWSNTMPRAQISWVGTATKGSVSVEVFDGLDNLVHSFEVDAMGAQGASGQTDYGFPGPGPAPFMWRIEVEFHDFTGTMGLELSSSH
jgi:hypothetical protein